MLSKRTSLTLRHHTSFHILYHLGEVPGVPSPFPFGQFRQSWTWNRISSESCIEIEQDARISRLVEAGCRHTTAQRVGPCSVDLEVDALRIRLRTIRLASSMESNDLMPDDVVARHEIGNGEVP